MLLNSANSQIKFQKAYFNSSYNGYISSLDVTSDNGYVIGDGGQCSLKRTDKYGNIKWDYRYYNNGYEYVKFVFQQEDGSTVIAGTSRGLGTLNNYLLLNTDSSGNIKWAKSYGDITYETCDYAIQTKDGGFVLVGDVSIISQYNAYVIKTDNKGNLLWSKAYDLRCSWYFVIETTDECLFLISSESDDLYHRYFRIMKIDKSGSVLWSKRYTTFENSIYPDVLIKTDKEEYIMSGIYTNNSLPSQRFMLKADSTGNIIWVKKYTANGNGYSIQQTSDGGFITSGRSSLGAYILKTDKNGNQLWNKIYGTGSANEDFQSIHKTNDGGFVLGGRVVYYGNSSGFLVKVDSMGNSGGCNETTLPNYTVDSALFTYTYDINKPAYKSHGGEIGIDFIRSNLQQNIHTYCSNIPNTAPEISPAKRSINVYKNCPYKLYFNISDVNLPNDTISPIKILPGHGSTRGTVICNNDTCLTYYPNLNYIGKDSIWIYVNDSSGLRDTAKVYINIVPNNINLGKDTTLCNYAQLILNAGTGYDSYLWQDGSTGQTFTVEIPGAYWVKVTSGLCSTRDTINISYIYYEPITLGKDTALCEGSILTLNAHSGYTSYKWQDNSTDSTFAVNSEGLHWVKVTSGICGMTDSIYVKYDTIPVINLGSDTILCNDANITLYPGSGFDNYLWQDGSHDTTFNVTEADTCWVRIAAGACITSDTIKVTYSLINPVYLGNDTTLCEGDSIMLNAGAGYDSYLWQDSSTDSTLNVDNDGIYSVHATSGVCSINDTIVVSYDTIPKINLGNDTILCNNAAITLNPGAGFDSYLWHDGSTDSIFTVTIADTCWVRIMAGACTASDTIEVTYSYIKPVRLGNDTSLCEGDTLTLNAGNGYDTYLWQDSSSDSTMDASGTGTYNVKTSLGVCNSLDTIKITFDTVPVIDLGKDTILCNNATLTLNPGSGFDGYTWQDGSHNSSFKAIDPDTCWVNIQAGACSTSDTIKITYSYIKPVYLGKDTSLCEGDSMMLNAGAGYASYFWQNSSPDSTFTVKTEGSYWVKVTTGVCSIRDTISVSYDTIPDINLGNDTILCNDATLMLNPGNSFDSYLWQDGSFNSTFVITEIDTCWVRIMAGACITSDTIEIDYSYIKPVFLGNDTSLCEGDSISFNTGSGYDSYLWQNGRTDSAVTVDTIGIYWVKTSKGVCFSADTIRVEYDSIPIINLGKDTFICYYDTIVLSPGAGLDHYLWQDSSDNSSYSVTTKGLYWTEVISGACSARDTINISDSTLKIDIGKDTILCNNAMITLSAGTEFSDYEWQDGTNLSYFEVKSPDIYWVTALKDCFAGTDTLVVSFYPPVPNPALKYMNDTLIALQGYNYRWYYENVIIPNINSYMFSPEVEGLYKVEIADQNGCVNFDSITVVGNGCDSIDVFPNPCDKYVYINSHLLKINKITIMNTIGQPIRIYDKIPGNQFSISFENNLANGLYYLVIETAECTVRKALFVAKFNE